MTRAQAEHYYTQHHVARQNQWLSVGTARRRSGLPDSVLSRVLAVPPDPLPNKELRRYISSDPDAAAQYAGVRWEAASVFSFHFYRMAVVVGTGALSVMTILTLLPWISLLTTRPSATVPLSLPTDSNQQFAYITIAAVLGLGPPTAFLIATSQLAYQALSYPVMAAENKAAETFNANLRKRLGLSGTPSERHPTGQDTANSQTTDIPSPAVQSPQHTIVTGEHP